MKVNLQKENLLKGSFSLKLKDNSSVKDKKMTDYSNNNESIYDVNHNFFLILENQ